MMAIAMAAPSVSKTMMVNMFSIIVKPFQFQLNILGGLLDVAAPFGIGNTLVYLLVGEGYPRSFVGLNVVVFVNPTMRD
jgi:hypothetical protein